MTDHPLPPQDIDAEIAILGSCLLDPTAIDKIVPIVRGADFFKTAHRKIFDTLIEMRLKEIAIDMITLCHELKVKLELEACGSESYISRLTSSVPESGNFKYYANIVREKSQRRTLLRKATALIQSAYDESETPENVISEFVETIGDTIESVENYKPMQIDELENAEDLTWLIDGFLHDKRFAMLTSVPGKGKSIIALKIAVAIASGNPLFDKYPVLRQGAVLIIDEENGLPDLKDRYRKMQIPKGLPIYFLSFQGVKMDNPSSVVKLTKVIREIQPVLVIGDSLIDLHAANENAANEMIPVMTEFKKIVNTGIGVFLLHHQGKGMRSQDDSSRGSGSIPGAIDIEYQLNVDKSKDELILDTGKNRGCFIQSMRLKIEMEDGVLKVNYLGKGGKPSKDQIKQEIVNILRDCAITYTIRQIETALSNRNLKCCDEVVRKYLVELVDCGEITEGTTGRNNAKCYIINGDKE